MEGSNTPIANPEALVQRFGDETVLIHVQTERVFVLNYTASRLWELLVQGLTLDQIQAQMLEEFDVTQEQLSQEIDGLVSELAREGFVQFHA